MAIVGSCPKCERKLGLPPCPNCGGGGFELGHDVDSTLPAWVCDKCRIAQVYVTCPYCSAMVPAERFRADGCRLPGCLGLIVALGVVALAISVFGNLQPFKGWLNAVGRYIQQVQDARGPKPSAPAPSAPEQVRRPAPGPSPAPRPAPAGPPPVDWAARRRQLYDQHLAAFQPPATGRRVTVTLHGRTRMEGVLRALDRENLTLELDNRGTVVLGVDQFTPEDGRFFFARHAAEVLTAQDLRREKAAAGVR